MKKLLMFVALAALSFGCCKTVDTGECAVEKWFGRIVSQSPVTEGLYWYFPIGGEYVVLDTKNQKVVYNLKQYTQDVQPVDTEIQLTYRLRPDSVIAMLKTNGVNYREKLIDPIVFELVKGVFGKWEAMNVIPNREEATRLVKEGIEKEVKSFGIEVVILSVANIDFSDAFEQAVEEKQIAEQKALKAKNDTERIKQEAAQKVEMAKAEAAAMEARARALEKNKSLVLYEAIQKWDGVLPKQLLSSVVPFMDVDKDTGKVTTMTVTPKK